MLALLLAPALPSNALAESRWTQDGRFHLSGSFSAQTNWQADLNEWQSLDKFERAHPSRPALTSQRFELDSNASDLDLLLDLIALAEAGPDGYDAIHMGAGIRTPRPPTDMTLAEIFDWIRATPGQPHAIGRYQFIPSTLAELVRLESINLDEKFSPEIQRQLALRLIMDAGYSDFENGRLNQGQFMDRLARIWAGLPLANGRSAYHGYAGNQATISRAEFERIMTEIYGA